MTNDVTISKSNITKVDLFDGSVVFENIKENHWRITVHSTPNTYSSYWGAMPANTVKGLIDLMDSHYFAKNLIEHDRRYVPDWKCTFKVLRKFIREELGLKWYQHQAFQKDMRKAIKRFQQWCCDVNSKRYFVDMFESQFINDLDFGLIEDAIAEKTIKANFESITEPWHFIEDKYSNEFVWLMNLHTRIKTALSK